MYRRSRKYPELYRPAASKVWWCFIPSPTGGRRLRESTGLRDERAAYEWWRARVSGATLGPDKDPAPVEAGYPLESALASRLEWLNAGRLNADPTRKKVSAKTIEFYGQKSKQLLRVLGRSTPIANIGHADIRRYITTRTKDGVKGTTIHKELVTLGKAMQLARKDGHPCAVFKDIVPEDFAAKYVPKSRWLPQDEVDALLAVLPPKRAAVVAFIVATSATYPSEVAPVRPGDVDVKRGIVHLKGTKRETRDRTLKVPSHARKYLELAAKHLGPSGFEPWSNIRGDLHDASALLSMCAPCRAARLAWARHERGASKAALPDGTCKRCAKAPTFDRLSPNDLRRTFAQWLVRSGVPCQLVGDMMGHAPGSKMVQSVYGRQDAVSVADLVELALKRAPKGARRAG